jgi:hypothetical protein
MTGTCILCGREVCSRDDPTVDVMRLRRCATGLALAMLQHIGVYHQNEEQTAIDRTMNIPASKPNTILTLLEAASANASLTTALSFMKTDDPVLEREIGLMRDVVMRSIEQKQAAIMQTPGP